MIGALPSLAGQQVDRALVGLLALALAALFVLVARRWPLVLATGYLVVMGLVPIWTGLSVKVFVQPQVAMGMLVVAVAIPQLRRLGARLSPVDLVVGVFFLACLAPVAVGGSSVSYLFLAGVQYPGAYLVGRILPVLVGQGRLLVVVTAVFALVAVLALVEHLTGTNLFRSFPGSSAVHGQWEGIQLRGGVARAEGAFGHSIALGASLAMSLPMVLAAPVRVLVRVGAAVLILSAVVVTFSRIGLITACIGVVLSIIASSELPRRLRILLAAAGTGVAVVAVPLLSEVFLAAGDEATNSAAYRGHLVSLIGDIGVLGASSVFDRGPDGSVSFGAFGSIDSALILQGLWFGWASVAVAVALLAAAAVAVVLRRAGAPTIAMAAQIPALATVALITQYATMLWFVAGFAVCAQAARKMPAQALLSPVAGLPPTGDRAPGLAGSGLASVNGRSASVSGGGRL
jgi:hypothetical protein